MHPVDEQPDVVGMLTAQAQADGALPRQRTIRDHRPGLAQRVGERAVDRGAGRTRDGAAARPGVVLEILPGGEFGDEGADLFVAEVRDMPQRSASGFRMRASTCSQGRGSTTLCETARSGPIAYGSASWNSARERPERGFPQLRSPLVLAYRHPSRGPTVPGGSARRPHRGRRLRSGETP
jgi:hypothetical protein